MKKVDIYLKIESLKKLRESLKDNYRNSLNAQTKLKIDKLTYAILNLKYRRLM